MSNVGKHKSFKDKTFDYPSSRNSSDIYNLKPLNPMREPFYPDNDFAKIIQKSLSPEPDINQTDKAIRKESFNIYEARSRLVQDQERKRQRINSTDYKIDERKRL